MVLHAQPRNGPFAFSQLTSSTLCDTHLLKSTYLQCGLFMLIKVSRTPWRTAFGFKEWLQESSVLRVPYLPGLAYQFPVTFFAKFILPSISIPLTMSCFGLPVFWLILFFCGLPSQLSPAYQPSTQASICPCLMFLWMFLSIHLAFKSLSKLLKPTPFEKGATF